MIDTARLTNLTIATWCEIDHHDGRSVHQHFAPDGTLTFGTRTFTGHVEISALYAQRAAVGTRVARHVTTNFHRLTSAAQPTMTYLLCLFASDGQPPLPMTTPASIADVTDRFTEVEGELVVSRRTLAFVFVDPEQTMAVPIS